MRVLKAIILLVVIALTLKSMAQESCDTLPFINCDVNTIVRFDDNLQMEKLFDKLSNINNPDSNNFTIVHIGDSHLQAGFLTEKIKQQLFSCLLIDTVASPGFIFPYSVAQTNNPYFFSVGYSGIWNVCKNIDQENNCNIGLSGITLQTNDSVSEINIKMRNNKYNKPLKYYFDYVKVWHNNPESFNLKINGQTAETNIGFSELHLENINDSIRIEFSQKDNSFELYGIILRNSQSKINYHTFGLNGATALSYLKCNYLSEHLKQLNPDLIIISLGTNEAFDKKFSSLEHEIILKDFIFQIKDILPNSSFILTTINDHLKNEEENPLIIQVNDNILKVAKELNLMVWDFYNIMGGYNSIQEWHKFDLTGKDKIHFKRSGYEIQAELFSKAFLKLIENDKSYLQ